MSVYGGILLMAILPLMLHGFRDVALWNKFMWRSSIPPYRSTIGWRSFLGYLSIKDELLLKGFCFRSSCIFCKEESETLNHLMVIYRVNRELWLAISSLFGATVQCSSDLQSQIIATMNV